MKHVYEGKTKTVYDLEDGNFLLKFKDDVTGKDGVFDPGENAVGLSIEGMGNASLRLTKYFFEKLAERNIPTHYVDANIAENTMTVRPAVAFGKGLEVVCRFKAVGSFLKRYADLVEEAQELDAFVECTLKNDEKLDPPITKDALVMLGVMTDADYESLKKSTQDIARVVKEELATKGFELYDIKFEFGKAGDQVILIDEISGGNMRVYKDGVYIQPMDLVNQFLG